MPLGGRTQGRLDQSRSLDPYVTGACLMRRGRPWRRSRSSAPGGGAAPARSPQGWLRPAAFGWRRCAQAQVVLEGVDQLTEGAKVEIVPEGGAPAGPPTGRRRGPGGQGAGAGPGGRGPGGQGAPGGGQAPGVRAPPARAAPAQGDTGSGRRAAAALMNLSRPFILRPVATALLMAALLLVGHARLPAAAGLGAAAGRLPDDPHHHLLSGRQPGGDDELGDGAARAAVRSAAGPGADVVDELGRRVGDHAALRAREAARASPSRKCRRR